jgi:hypothetical protein
MQSSGPQFCGHEKQSQMPLRQESLLQGPQSVGQVAQFSGASQMPSPQNVVTSGAMQEPAWHTNPCWHWAGPCGLGQQGWSVLPHG